MFEVSLIMNIVVVSIFWSILYNESIIDCEGDPLKIFNVYWAHIIPCFSVTANFSLTNVVMRASHVKILPFPAIAYGIVNYFES